MTFVIKETIVEKSCQYGNYMATSTTAQCTNGMEIMRLLYERHGNNASPNTFNALNIDSDAW
jgi:hypothetical protein